MGRKTPVSPLSLLALAVALSAASAAGARSVDAASFHSSDADSGIARRGSLAAGSVWLHVHTPVRAVDRAVAIPLELAAVRERDDAPDSVTVGICQDTSCESWEPVELSVTAPLERERVVTRWVWPASGQIALVDPDEKSQLHMTVQLQQRSDRNVVATYALPRWETPPNATWRPTDPAGRSSLTGGVSFYDMTEVFDRWPQLVHAYAAIVFDSDEPLRGGPLTDELGRYLRRGGVVVVKGQPSEPPPPRLARLPALTRTGFELVEHDSSRLLRVGDDPVLGRVFAAGAGRVVYVEHLDESVPDALLAVASRLRHQPAAPRDLRSSPAVIAAAVDVSRPAGGAAALAILLAAGSALLPLWLLRRRSAFVGLLALGVGTSSCAVILLGAASLLDAAPAESKVVTHRLVEGASAADVNTAAARRSGSTQDELHWTPLSSPAAVGLLGNDPLPARSFAGSQRGAVIGRAGRDVIVTAATQRVVDEAGTLHLRDQRVEDGLLRGVVENDTGVDLDLVHLVSQDWQARSVGPLAAGETTSFSLPDHGLSQADDVPFADAAMLRLSRELRGECRSRPSRDEGPLVCVVGAGRQPDGTLIGWQVKLP